MKFFIPLAGSPEEAASVYDGIRKHLSKELGATFSNRKVQYLRWQHDGTEYEAEVGKAGLFNNELVIAILYEPARDLYHICTPNRGVVHNGPILAGAWSVKSVNDFGEPDFN